MRLYNIILQEIFLISLFISPLNSSITKVSAKDIETNQQDFINNYLKESEKKRVERAKSTPNIEVGYSNTSKYKRRYIRGQRLRDAKRELEKLREENQRLSIERERLELENEILQMGKKSTKGKKKRVIKTFKPKVKRYSSTKKSYKKKRHKYKKRHKKSRRNRSRKIFIKVDSVSKRMRVYRGSRLIYNWKIRFRETLKRHKKYKRGYSYNKPPRKHKIYFKNGQATRSIRTTSQKTLYSKIRLRKKYITRLNNLIKKYGRRNVIIKITR